MTKVKRNAPCPCGSGRKYKHCCGKPGSHGQKDFTDSFIELPEANITYLLDTCVWGDIVRTGKTAQSFLSFFQSNNLLAGITHFSLFELSRATHLTEGLDDLFRSGGHYVWIPLLYDQLLNLEIASYPDPPAMRWMPMSHIVGEDQHGVMSKLLNEPNFIRKRDEYLQFGHDEFMSLEKFKANYPPDNDGNYTPVQAREFCWCNAVDFLGRQFRSFLLQFKDDASAFDARKIPSLQMRSLLLFYKYYIHNQSPRESDFSDFAIVSYVPYVDIFVTERNILNAMRHIELNGMMPSATSFMHVNEFITEVTA